MLINLLISFSIIKRGKILIYSNQQKFSLYTERIEVLIKLNKFN